MRMLRIPFEWLVFAFECFESVSSGSKLDSNASNPFRMVRICIRMLWISFKGFELAFECFEFCSNGENLHSNDSKRFRIVRICIRMLRIPFEWFKFALERFKSLSNWSNLHSNASNPTSKHSKGIWSTWMPILTTWKGFECFKSLSNG